jgi:LysM repeat protein
MSVQTQPSTARRAADTGRGLGALLGVIALVAGVPVALIAWVGSPLPAELPTLSDVSSALRDTYIPDSFLIKALALVCWLVWIELVTSLIVEAVAYARGRKASPVPLAGGVQRGAARLVAAIAMLGAVMTTRGGPEPAGQPARPLAPSATAVVSLVVDEGQTGRDGNVPAAPSEPPAPAPTYHVQRRDTLWDIAERHLGDPFRWHEIFQINRDRPQADGTSLTDPDLIYVGWQLELPADATGLAPAAPPVPPSPEPSSAVPASPAAGSGAGPQIVESGMVLIDDGAGGGAGGGDVVLATEAAPHDSAGAAAYDPGAMVLLPDDPLPGGSGHDGPAVLAGPPWRQPHHDETAARHGGPPSSPSPQADDD